MHKKTLSSIVLATSVILLLLGCKSNQTGSRPSQPSPSPTVDQETVSPESITPDIPLSDSIPDKNLNDPILQMETASLQYPSQNDTWKYNVYDCYIEITGYLGSEDADVVIPPEIDGLPVWKIGTGALSESKIKSARLPDCLEIIDSSAFEGSTLNAISMPEKLYSIGGRAFALCRNLLRITIPQNIVIILDETFWGCSSLLEVEFPQSIYYIAEGAFGQCHSLTNVALPENVKEIERSAFWDCKSLSQIEIGENVESIGADVFQHCEKLQYAVLPASVLSIGDPEHLAISFKGVADNFQLTVLNPNMIFDDEIFDHWDDNSNKVICGYAGSTAAQFCAEHNITFQLIE